MKKVNNVRVNMRMIIFLLLVEECQRDMEAYTPIWKFVGEHHLQRLGHCFVSYEVSARMSELYHDPENAGLIERELVTGKSGAQYFAYRLAEGWTSRKMSSELLAAISLYYGTSKA